LCLGLIDGLLRVRSYGESSYANSCASNVVHMKMLALPDDLLFLSLRVVARVFRILTIVNDSIRSVDTWLTAAGINESCSLQI